MNLKLHKLKPKPDNSVILAEIEACAKEIAACYEKASPQAQASMVSFGMALAKVRTRLLEQTETKGSQCHA